MSFAHLHLHTEYSLQNGVCRISEIPKAVKAMGQSSVAITDHGVLFGALNFYDACIKEGVKPIIGCEMCICDGDISDRALPSQDGCSHITLLCKNNDGYRSLTNLVSLSYTEGISYNPRINYDMLREYSDGLICLTGCMKGAIPDAIIKGDMETAENTAFELFDIFGDDVYLEVQDHGDELEKRIKLGMRELSEMTGIPLVATNNVHYLKRSDAYTKRVMDALHDGTTVDDGPDDKAYCEEYYLKSEDEMSELFEDMPKAVENAGYIAEDCNVTFDFSKKHLPKAKLKKGENADDVLRNNAVKGFERLIKCNKIDFKTKSKEEYENRLEYELSVICSMGFSDYFLIVADFVGYAKANDIPVGPGRGSGAGSLVAYLIGITEIDALQYDLVFETFLNPERVSMPDFDIDFCAERRGEVIKYVSEKYSSECVAHIAAFNTFAAKQAIRDVARTIGMSYAEADAVVRAFPGEADTIARALDKSKDFRDMRYTNPRISHLLSLALAIEGMPKNITTHAAGIVIFDKPLRDYIPLCTSGEEVLTQYDMNGVSRLGLLKFDFLGIRYLTVIAKAQRIIRERNPDFDIGNIPSNDRNAFELLSKGQSVGLFQIESPGMQKLLARMKPKSIVDIMDAIALYRPGPAKFIDKYIENRSTGTHIGYKNPILEDILAKTYGCIVYSEQVTMIFRAVAGYSFGKADVVSRAIKKKNLEVIENERKGFIEGALAKGESEEAATELFEDMVGFANYGFKKSHAAAYGIVSYQTAYLKANYACEYFSALLSSVLGDLGKTALYIEDAKRMGLKIFPPDVNLSKCEFTPEKGGIRFGLGALKNTGTLFCEFIEQEQKERPFTSFVDFVRRVAKRENMKKPLESLIKCGAFDSFSHTRASLLASLDTVVNKVISSEKYSVEGQIDMFGSNDEKFGDEIIKKLPELDRAEIINNEKETSGVVISSINPVTEQNNQTKQGEKKSDLTASKMYLRFERFDDPRYKRALALISIFSGSVKVVLYSKSENKYIGVDGMGVADTDFIRNELTELLGDGNVVVK